MKRITAILFLSVLLFNLTGYQLVIDLLQDHHETELSARLDKEEYNNEDLVSIKTALSLPYYTNSEEYERVDGTIELEGLEYKYVKRRIYNDSLELLCLPNTVKEQLQSAKVDFFKLSNDWQSAQDGKKSSGTIKLVLPEYCEEAISFSCNVFALVRNSFASLHAPTLPFLSSRVQEQPPDSVQAS